MVLRVNDDGSRRRAATSTNPLPMSLPTYEDVDGTPSISIMNMDRLLDALERIQQQLGQITGINLDKGERIE